MGVDLIVGEGVALRMPDPRDRERWLELLHDPEQLRFGMPAVVSVPAHVDDLDERVAEARRKFAARQPTTFVVVTEDEAERFLGTVGWSFHVPAPLQVADVGYAVHPDARGRGVATRALRALTHWLTAGATGPHAARVQLDHSVENPVSCRTALGAGFAREGVRKGFLPLRDPTAPDGVRRHDVCLHGFLARP
jgi:RimJ/RimL family protein N-acetyltransferase